MGALVSLVIKRPGSLLLLHRSSGEQVQTASHCFPGKAVSQLMPRGTRGSPLTAAPAAEP